MPSVRFLLPPRRPLLRFPLFLLLFLLVFNLPFSIFFQSFPLLTLLLSIGTSEVTTSPIRTFRGSLLAPTSPSCISSPSHFFLLFPFSSALFRYPFAMTPFKEFGDQSTQRKHPSGAPRPSEFIGPVLPFSCASLCSFLFHTPPFLFGNLSRSQESFPQ